jgi:cell division protein FtsN
MNKLPQGVDAPPPEPVAGVAPAPAKKPEPAPRPATPDAAASASGPTIQLGAYASSIKADTAWSMLSARFPELGSLGKSVVSASVGGKTIYRLRAAGSADQSRAACAALKAAGESCLVVK